MIVMLSFLLFFSVSEIRPFPPKLHCGRKKINSNPKLVPQIIIIFFVLSFDYFPNAFNLTACACSGLFMYILLPIYVILIFLFTVCFFFFVVCVDLSSSRMLPSLCRS